MFEVAKSGYLGGAAAFGTKLKAACIWLAGSSPFFGWTVACRIDPEARKSSSASSGLNGMRSSNLEVDALSNRSVERRPDESEARKNACEGLHGVTKAEQHMKAREADYDKAKGTVDEKKMRKRAHRAYIEHRRMCQPGMEELKRAAIESYIATGQTRELDEYARKVKCGDDVKDTPFIHILGEDGKLTLKLVPAKGQAWLETVATKAPGQFVRIRGDDGKKRLVPAEPRDFGDLAIKLSPHECQRWLEKMAADAPGRVVRILGDDGKERLVPVDYHEFDDLGIKLSPNEGQMWLGKLEKLDYHSGRNAPWRVIRIIGEDGGLMLFHVDNAVNRALFEDSDYKKTELSEKDVKTWYEMLTKSGWNGRNRTAPQPPRFEYEDDGKTLKYVHADNWPASLGKVPPEGAVAAAQGAADEATAGREPVDGTEKPEDEKTFEKLYEKVKNKVRISGLD